MARSLALGNGTLLVNLDDRGQVRDFYFPYVGQENHIQEGNTLSIGVWVDGVLRWLSDPKWEVSITYVNESLVSKISLRHPELKIRCEIHDIVYNEENIFLRSITLYNESDKERDVRLFFNQQLTISATSHADTAYYNPKEKAIIHYKGRRVFWVSGHVGGEVFDDYSIGLFQIEGKEGTWRDAEDGVLSKNPIEHGSVDSTIGGSVRMEPRGTASAAFWITVGTTFKEVKALNELVVRKTSAHLLTTTHDFWQAWTNKSRFTFHGLDDDVVSLFKKSLLIIRTHCDNHGGIIASGDGASGAYGRDTYGYVWPRDGVYIALAMDRAGYRDIARRFIEFVNDVLTEDGYILHKYQPDRSLGSSWHPWIQEGKEQLAIQEDETSSLLFLLWKHYIITRDIEDIENIYNQFIKRIADFLVSYRDEETGLPLPSYDLWEEKYGVSTYTAASVYGGLNAASHFASLLGKDEECAYYREVADQIKRGILTYLFDDEKGYFVKLFNKTDKGLQYDKTVDMSSFYGVFWFGVLPVDDTRLERCFEVMKRELSDPLPIGGFPRYANDQYFTIDHSLPGNPWIITTLWGLHYTIMKAKSIEELDHVNDELAWVVQHALKSGVLSEQLNPHTGEQVSIAPLAWSHAEYIRVVIEYMNKVERLGVKEAIKPINEYVDEDGSCA